jgi:hypothetical protein
MTDFSYQGIPQNIQLQQTCLEEISISYNESSVLLYTTEDYDTLQGILQPNGFSNNTINFSQTTHTFDEINDVYDLSDDYGLISVPASISVDNGSVLTSTSLYPFGGLTFGGSANTEYVDKIFYGSAKYNFVHHPNDIGGTLFGFGEKLESKTYDYNESSVLLYTTEDLGDLNVTSDSPDDYGLVSVPASFSFDQGSILTSTSLYPFGGLTFSGSAITQVNYRLYLSGTSVEKVTYSPEGTGTLFGFGQVLESRSYRYNEPLVPYGSLSISGSAVESFTLDQPESTQLFEIYGKAVLNVTPRFYGRGSFVASGQAIEKDSDTYVASGSLFSFGEKVESITYRYSEDSIEDSINDYGSILDTNLTVFEDSGFITDNPGPILDYGLISLDIIQPLVPYGSLSISGSSVERFTSDYLESTQLFEISGSASDIKLTFSSDTTQIFQIYGQAIEKDSDTYIGQGSLFTFGEKVESRTYRYSEDSVDDPTDDYGSVVDDDLTGLQDYEFIINDPTSTIDHGSIIESILSNQYPYGSLSISGSAVERSTSDYSGSTQLFEISGSASDTRTYYTENTQLFQIYGQAIEKDSDTYVTSGSLFSFGEKVESRSYRYSEPLVPYGSLSISGSAVEKFTSNYLKSVQLFQISGSASDIKLTFSSDTTQIFQIYGQAITKDVDSYVATGSLFGFSSGLESFVQRYGGFGSINISGSKFESFTRTTYIGSGIISLSGDSRNYSPVYPINSGDPNAGKGIIQIVDAGSIYRATLPYKAKGSIFVSGFGNESFIRTNYTGSGLITFSGRSFNREIAVYANIGSGFIQISTQTQPIIEKNTESYSGSGTITLSDQRVNRRAFSYSGNGSVKLTSSAQESLSSQTPEQTILFNTSGTARERFIAQTPETEVLYEFSGNSVLRKGFAYAGFGQILFAESSSVVTFTSSISGQGTIRFKTHLVDNTYDTCDSEDITCDYENSASIRFVANPPESTQLFNVFGFANTNQIHTNEYIGLGNIQISESIGRIRKINSYVGVGTIFELSASQVYDVDSYVGKGTLFALSGSTESKLYSSTSINNSVLFVVSGSSKVAFNKEYPYFGITTTNLYGNAESRIKKSSIYSGIGSISISGELVHPNIRFIPSPRTSGSINVYGIGNESATYHETLVGNRSIFTISSGFESFGRSTYIGMGTVFIDQLNPSSISINNPYQIPRSYVIII